LRYNKAASIHLEMRISNFRGTSPEGVTPVFDSTILLWVSRFGIIRDPGFAKRYRVGILKSVR
jgi:hypothetical protein